jgi:hypothetical protein
MSESLSLGAALSDDDAKSRASAKAALLLSSSVRVARNELSPPSFLLTV